MRLDKLLRVVSRFPCWIVGADCAYNRGISAGQLRGQDDYDSDLIEPWWRNRHDGKIGRAIFA
jgi:hypothetical protein